MIKTISSGERGTVRDDGNSQSKESLTHSHLLRLYVPLLARIPSNSTTVSESTPVMLDCDGK